MHLPDYEIDNRRIISFLLRHKKMILSMITVITSLFICYHFIAEDNMSEVRTILKIDYMDEVDYRDKQKQRQLIVNYNKLLFEDRFIDNLMDQYKGYCSVKVSPGKTFDTIDVKVKTSIKKDLNELNNIILDELQNRLEKLKSVDKVMISVEGELIKENYLPLLLLKSFLVLSGALITSLMVGLGLDLKRRK